MKKAHSAAERFAANRAEAITDAELCANFLTKLRSQGFNTLQAELIDTRSRNNFVPTASQDEDTLAYVESISGKDKERAQVWVVGDEDMADLNDEAYAVAPVAELVEEESQPLAVVLHVSNRHGEYVHRVEPNGRVVFCWDKARAGRVLLDDVAKMEGHLATLGLEVLLEWS